MTALVKCRASSAAAVSLTPIDEHSNGHAGQPRLLLHGLCQRHLEPHPGLLDAPGPVATPLDEQSITSTPRSRSLHPSATESDRLQLTPLAPSTTDNLTDSGLSAGHGDACRTRALKQS